MVAQPVPTFNLEEFAPQVLAVKRFRGSFPAFLRELVWIEGKDTGQAIPFDPWPDQVAILPDLEAQRVVVLKARQLGLTWMVAAYCLWRAIFKKLQLVVIVSSKEDTAKEFLGRIKFMLDRLPKYPWLPLYEVIRETTEELEFRHKDKAGHAVNSVIKSLPTTKSGAQSKTPTLLVIDEAHESRDVGRLYAASLPGIEAAGGQVIVIANAVKDTGGWPWVRSIFVGAMAGTNDFRHVFLPWWSNPSRSRELIEEPETHRMIARFRLEQYRGGMDEEDFSQHYPESEAEAISLMGGSYFGTALKRHTSPIPGMRGRLEWTTDKTLEFVEDRRGLWEFWRFPYRLHPEWQDGHDPHWLDRYAVGTDVAEGLGQDYSVLYVMDRLNQDIIARCRSNRLDADQWGYEVYKAVQFFKDPEQPALLTPARRGAVATIKRLEKEGFRNFYVRQIPDVIGNGMTSEIGFMETEDSKKELLGDLKTYLRTTKARVYDSLLLDECSTYIRHDNGRLGAEEGHHDDCVIAAACAIQGDLWLERRPRQVVRDDRPYWLRKHEEQGRSAWTV